MTEPSAPDSELLRTFLSVAEYGNTTAAATATHRTQSSVSLRIKRLEQLLGVELFERTARGMRLNHAGRALLPSAQRVVDEVDQLAAAFRDRLAGSIRIGVPDDYGQFVLEHALARFCGHHPEVAVSVTSGCSGPFPDLIESGELDMAIYSAPPQEADGAFFTEPVVWAAHRDFVLPADGVVPLALFDRACWWRDVPTAALDDAGVPARVVVTSGSHEGVRAAICARLAVGILPGSVLPSSAAALPGLPDLPPSSLVFLESATTPGDAGEAVRTAMRGAVEAAFSLTRRTMPT